MAPKEISREELRRKYERQSVKSIARELGVSRPTVYKLLDDAGIPRKQEKKVVLTDDTTP